MNRIYFHLEKIILFQLFIAGVVFGDSNANSNTTSLSTCQVNFKGETQNYAACHKVSNLLQIFWTVRDQDGEIDTLFRAKSDGYAAFGWGYEKMINSKAIVAYNNPAGGVTIDEFDLFSKSTIGVNPTARKSFANGQAEFSDGELIGFFTRPLKDDKVSLSVNEKASTIWAIGPKPKEEGKLEIHTDHGISTFILGTERVTKGETESQVSTSSKTSNRKRMRYYIHAALMSIAWLIIIPTAILVIQFMKKGVVSFRIHSGLNFVAMIMIVTATGIVAFRDSIAWLHLFIGMVAIASPVLQIAIGIARPEATPERRQSTWFKIHASVGYISYLFANINVHVGLRFYGGTGAIIFHGIFGFITVMFVIIYAVLRVGEAMRRTMTRKHEEPI